MLLSWSIYVSFVLVIFLTTFFSLAGESPFTIYGTENELIISCGKNYGQIDQRIDYSDLCMILIYSDIDDL